MAEPEIEIETVNRAVLFLAGRCDGAHQQDGVGFNRYDTGWGHDAANKIEAGQFVSPIFAYKVISKYRGQLERGGIDLPSLQRIQEIDEARRVEREKRREIEKAAGVRAERVGGVIAVRFPYDPELVAKVRDIPKRRWNDPVPKAWCIPPSSLPQLLATFPDIHLSADLDAEINAKRRAEETAERARQEEAAIALTRLEEIESEVPLYDHQKVGVRWLIETRRGILADDMGIGKTRQALVAGRALGHRVLVVAPAGLRINWFREAEMVRVPIEVHSWAKVPPPPSCDYTLIVDEAHYGQSLKSARTKKMLALAKKAKAVWLLTGTPLKNGRPSNLYPLLAAIDHKLAEDKKRYDIHYCDAHATRWTQWDVTGACHLEELHANVADSLLRRLKGECLDLPEKTRVLRAVDLSTEAQGQYSATLEEMQAEYKSRVATGQIKPADAIVLLNHLRHASSLAKVESAIELAEEVIEQGGQVVLFCGFLDSAQQIADALGAGRITGADSTEARQEAIDQFQAGKRKAMVCTLGAGNVGITLTAAQTVILVDRPWTPGDAMQAEDRLHRIGQAGNVFCLWLQATSSDTLIDALLGEKHERAEIVLGGKRQPLPAVTSVADIAALLLGEAKVTPTTLSAGAPPIFDGPDGNDYDRDDYEYEGDFDGVASRRAEMR